MMRLGRWSFAAICCATFLLGVPLSASAEPSEKELATARRLFSEANALEQDKHWAEAEPKLREALEIKETPGLRYHLGFCLENQDKLIEALAEYNRAEKLLAEGAKAPDVAELVGPARDGVKKRAAKLTIKLPAPVEGATVELDGQPFKAELLNRAVLQNPGKHLLTADAPGRQPFRREIMLDISEVEEVAIALPEIAKTTPPKRVDANMDEAAPASADEGVTSSGSERTIVLIGEAAFTVIALGAGVWFTLEKSKTEDDIDAANAEVDAAAAAKGLPPEDQSRACAELQPPPSACRKLEDLVAQKQDQTTLATIGFVGAGIGAAATITTFLLWKPEPKRQSARIAPILDGRTFGLAAVGRF